MRPSLTRRNILVRRIPRWNCENLFHVIGKATVAQVQVGDTGQTEFVICDQSIDTNHGYAKRAVVNSEVAKRRTALEQRLATLRRWTASARVRYQHATALSDRLRKQAKARGAHELRNEVVAGSQPA